jgi:hypothetical protein
MDRRAARGKASVWRVGRIRRRVRDDPSSGVGRGTSLGSTFARDCHAGVLVLVPGTVGLIGIAQFFGSDDPAGLGNIVNALVTFILIGMGMFVGNALVLHVRSRRAVASPIARMTMR